MKVSVVVPVRNEEGFIARTLDALLAQEFPEGQYEILVVDGESDDRTRAIVGEYACANSHVTLHENPRRWSSAARNIGINQSSGEFVVIIDGHCELRDRDYLAKVVAAFERSNADCLGRPQPLNIDRANRVQRAIALARSCWLGHHPDSYIFASGEGFVPAHSVAAAYRRTVFEKVGTFDESFDACEDVELNHRIDRAGLKCYWTDRLALPYVPRASFGGLFRQLKRYGRGRVRLMRKHAELTSIKSLMPGLLVAGIVAGLFVGAMSRELAVAYVAIVSLYLSIVFATSIVLAVRSRVLRMIPLVVTSFLAIHFGAGWGVLVEAIKAERAPGVGRA